MSKKPPVKKAKRVPPKPTGTEPKATVASQTTVSPTLGELDLHLFAEGRHEAIYEKLGAHIRKVGRVNGVSFAVWAPHG